MFNESAETSPLAPTPHYPERVGSVFERTMAPSRAGGAGPMRFQEGLGTDTDVPSDFTVGVMSGYQTAPGNDNHNAVVWRKGPEETLKQRAHAGSAAWPEAPTFTSEFGNAAFSDYGDTKFERITRSGSHYMRQNPTVVNG